jgi:predicted ribosome quality control (RQC) complex YloA/Tae2 family protein
MKVKLYLNKSLEENAALYFETAKKARKKLEGVRETLETFKKKQKKALAAQTEHVSSIKKITSTQKKWFEKFKWFVTSEGFLVVGGRDATTNEILIKKNTQTSDIVFHTDMVGSPFVVIKKDSSQDVFELLGVEYTTETPGEVTLKEAAQFTATHSRAWRLGHTTVDVFYVAPDQLSKEANSGEYISKGSFMVRGKRTEMQTTTSFGLGIVKKTNILLSGPVSSLRAHAASTIEIEQGKEKSSVVAKQVAQFFRKELDIDVHTDDIIRLLPSGGCQVKKVRKTKAQLKKKN